MFMPQEDPTRQALVDKLTELLTRRAEIDARLKNQKQDRKLVIVFFIGGLFLIPIFGIGILMMLLALVEFLQQSPTIRRLEQRRNEVNAQIEHIEGRLFA